jgi:hypothetical protein
LFPLDLTLKTGRLSNYFYSLPVFTFSVYIHLIFYTFEEKENVDYHSRKKDPTETQATEGKVLDLHCLRQNLCLHSWRVPLSQEPPMLSLREKPQGRTKSHKNHLERCASLK